MDDSAERPQNKHSSPRLWSCTATHYALRNVHVVTNLSSGRYNLYQVSLLESRDFSMCSACIRLHIITRSVVELCRLPEHGKYTEPEYLPPELKLALCSNARSAWQCSVYEWITGSCLSWTVRHPCITCCKFTVGMLFLIRLVALATLP